MKLGLSSYTFGWGVGVAGREPARPLDEHGLLDKCLEHGVKLLQIGDNLPLDRFDSARVERLAARASAEGVQLEIGARGLTKERIRNYANIARRLDARILRFVIDDAGFQPETPEIIATLREALPLLEDVTLGIENHDRFAAATLAGIIRTVGSARVGICLDTANSLGAGEGLDTVLRELAPFAVNLHIKDFAIARVDYLMGFKIEGRPAGKGMLNIPELVKRLAEFKRCHTAILELWTPPEANIDDTIAKEAAWAGQSLSFLKSFFDTP